MLVRLSGISASASATTTSSAAATATGRLAVLRVGFDNHRNRFLPGGDLAGLATPILAVAIVVIRVEIVGSGIDVVARFLFFGGRFAGPPPSPFARRGVGRFFSATASAPSAAPGSLVFRFFLARCRLGRRFRSGLGRFFFGRLFVGLAVFAGIVGGRPASPAAAPSATSPAARGSDPAAVTGRFGICVGRLRVAFRAGVLVGRIAVAFRFFA